MRERLFDARCTAATTGVEALHDDRLANVSFCNDERIDVEIVVVLCVCDGRFKGLLDRFCNALARELEFGQSALDLLAADHRGNQVELLGADADRARNCLRFIILQPAFGFCLAHCYFLFAFLSAP
ncbi:hypothetical protein D9M70_513750 [compost metagenome]